MKIEDLIIKAENEKGGEICLITDDHKKHLKTHLKYIWKPRIFKHILKHFILMYKARKNGIPHISTEEVYESR